MTLSHCSAVALFALVLIRAEAGSSKQQTATNDRAAPVTDLWTVDYTTGVLWQMGRNTPLAYTLTPQIISLRSPAHIHLTIGSGELTVRARGSLLMEPILKGPESLYLGVSLSPSLEYWLSKTRKTTCLYASAGGGIGHIDSRGVEGGQGQDLTLNWFAEAGVRHYFSHNTCFYAGCMFQHWSNGGMTDPNPGVDALGPVVGLSLTF